MLYYGWTDKQMSTCMPTYPRSDTVCLTMTVANKREVKYEQYGFLTMAVANKREVKYEQYGFLTMR